MKFELEFEEHHIEASLKVMTLRIFGHLAFRGGVNQSKVAITLGREILICHLQYFHKAIQLPISAVQKGQMKFSYSKNIERGEGGHFLSLITWNAVQNYIITYIVINLFSNSN